MKIKIIIVLSLLSGCVINGQIIRKCPGSTRLVTITESESTNVYLAQASEEARLLAKCAELDIRERIKESREE